MATSMFNSTTTSLLLASFISPTEVGTMKKLRWLYLNNNQLSSRIPPEIGDLSRLGYLWLSDNMLTGWLDSTMFTRRGFKYLQEIMLHNNLLKGTIPDEIGNIPGVRFISLHKNKFTGTIPSSLGLLNELEVLKLHENDLTGSVPQEICHLVQRGTLQEITIDCDKVTCDCGCSCTSDDSDLPPEDHTITPLNEDDIDNEVVAGEDVTEEGITTEAPESEVLTEEPTVTPTSEPSASPVTETWVTSLPTSLPTVPSTTKPAVNSASVERTPEDNPNAITGAADFMMQLPHFTKEALLEPEPPQSLALAWFQSDPKLLSYSLERKLQRFGKSTTGNVYSVIMTRSITHTLFFRCITLFFFVAMTTLYYSTNGTEWKNSEGWLDYEQHECDWFNTFEDGEVCSEDSELGERTIKHLMQWDNNLEGPIPP